MFVVVYIHHLIPHSVMQFQNQIPFVIIQWNSFREFSTFTGQFAGLEVYGSSLASWRPLELHQIVNPSNKYLVNANGVIDSFIVAPQRAVLFEKFFGRPVVLPYGTKQQQKHKENFLYDQEIQ